MVVKSIAFNMLKYGTKPLKGKGLAKIKPLGNFYRAISRNVIPETSKVVNIHGCKYRVNITRGHDIDGIAQALVFDREYEPTTTALFKAHINGGNVIDVGANIGYYSVLAGMNTKGQVWAFEPDLHNFGELCHNVRLNVLPNVICRHAAISDTRGAGILYHSQDESGAHSLIDYRENTTPVTVGLVTIDEEIHIPISLLKTDTEGHEFAVLTGARRTISENDLTLICEFWPDGLEADGRSPLAFWELLLHLGFTRVSMIDEFRRLAMPIESIAPAIEYNRKHGYSCNLLCRKGV